MGIKLINECVDKIWVPFFTKTNTRVVQHINCTVWLHVHRASIVAASVPYPPPLEPASKIFLVLETLSLPHLESHSSCAIHDDIDR